MPILQGTQALFLGSWQVESYSVTCIASEGPTEGHRVELKHLLGSCLPAVSRTEKRRCSEAMLEWPPLTGTWKSGYSLPASQTDPLPPWGGQQSPEARMFDWNLSLWKEHRREWRTRVLPHQLESQYFVWWKEAGETVESIPITYEMSSGVRTVGSDFQLTFRGICV